jgi:hypothetical protein
MPLWFWQEFTGDMLVHRASTFMFGEWFQGGCWDPGSGIAAACPLPRGHLAGLPATVATSPERGSAGPGGPVSIRSQSQVCDEHPEPVVAHAETTS